MTTTQTRNTQNAQKDTKNNALNSSTPPTENLKQPLNSAVSTSQLVNGYLIKGKVAGVQSRHGTSKAGKPYEMHTLVIDPSLQEQKLFVRFGFDATDKGLHRAFNAYIGRTVLLPVVISYDNYNNAVQATFMGNIDAVFCD